MPSADQHKNKAARNRQFLDSIDIEKYPDWVVVSAFYTAVQLIEKMRAEAGNGDSTSHEDRLDYVQHQLPSNVHTAYHILQNASMLARYQAMKDFFAQFQSESVREEIVGKRLAEIEKHSVERATRAARRVCYDPCRIRPRSNCELRSWEEMTRHCVATHIFRNRD
jgi:hypothetical protein